MPEQFDWRTDDEVWVDEPVSEPEPVTAVSRRAPWLAVVVILAFLSVAAFVVYRQLNQRIEATHKAIEAEILLTHALVQRANWQQDDELLRSILSGRELDWTDLQLDLVKEGHLFDRAGLGLQAQTAVANHQVTVAPDLQAAELLFEQEHAFQNGDGVTETVNLQHTAVFRLGQKWLYAPPTEEFWGSWQTRDGRYLSIAYRQRDEEIVSQLAFDFEALIAEVCRLPDMACPDDLHLHLRLDSEAESLLITADTQTLLEHSLRLNLPTPSLAGLPMDEAGYQALLQGYERHLAAAIIVEQAKYACCDQDLMHRALLDWQLYQLGLGHWPLSTSDYDELFYNNIRTSSFSRGWYAPVGPPQWQYSYMLVQFVATEAKELSPMAIQRTLLDDLTYTAWLNQMIGGSFEEKLFDFLMAQTTVVQTIQAPSLPEQDLLYVCQGKYIHQYDLHKERSSLLPITDLSSSYVNLRPYESGYVLEERYPNPAGTGRADHSVVTLVDGNGRRLLFDSATDDALLESTFLSRVAPDNRHFLLASFNSNSEEFALVLLDSADCPDGVCRRYSIPSWPLWSPSGQMMLWQEQTAVPGSSDSAPLILANALGQNPVRIAEDVAAVFFWQDDETVGYVRQDGAEQALVVRQLGSPLDLVIAREADFRPWLPELQPNQSLHIGHVQPDPANPNRLLVMVAIGEQWGRRRAYFLLERQSERHEIMLLKQMSEPASTQFSPDGRFLIFISNNPTASDFYAVVDILDLDTGQESRLIAKDAWLGLDWSAHGNWLVQLYDEYLLFLAPAYDYEQVIPGKFSDCGNVIWLNK